MKFEWFEYVGPGCPAAIRNRLSAGGLGRVYVGSMGSDAYVYVCAEFTDGGDPWWLLRVGSIDSFTRAELNELEPVLINLVKARYPE